MDNLPQEDNLSLLISNYWTDVPLLVVPNNLTCRRFVFSQKLKRLIQTLYPDETLDKVSDNPFQTYVATPRISKSLPLRIIKMVERELLWRSS